MKEQLAERLLIKTMGWSDERATKERLDIQLLSEYKYDYYQQYTQGMRFIESLAHWINQFDEGDREFAYNFVKENLIFISEEQMIQLVSLSFAKYIKPILVQQAYEASINIQNLKAEKESIYNYFLSSTLFLGLSDGAHIDYFRRCNPFLDNEQVFMHYDYSDKRSEKLKDSLVSRNKKFPFSKLLQTDADCFSNIVILDDFSASGISFIRHESDCWKGKIPALFDNLIENHTVSNSFSLCIILYIATTDAINYIEKLVNEYVKEHNKFQINLSVNAVQVIDSIKVDVGTDIFHFLSKYTDTESVVDKHFEKGKHDFPFLGFNECSLPLILYHNTPNNSFPLLWYNSNATNSKALFPRITRHK